MTLYECAYKISLTILFAVFIYQVTPSNWIFSLLLGHIINYIFNGQLFVLTRYLFDSSLMTTKKIERTVAFANKCRSRFGIKDVLVTGSGSRNKMTTRSDLDLRVYHGTGVVRTLNALIYASILRTQGTFTGCAVDVYCFSDVSFLEKLDAQEVPISLFASQELQRKALRPISTEGFDPVVS